MAQALEDQVILICRDKQDHLSAPVDKDLEAQVGRAALDPEGVVDQDLMIHVDNHKVAILV